MSRYQVYIQPMPLRRVSPSQPLFSPHSVYGLVRAVTNGRPIPGEEDYVYEYLAFSLNRLKQLFDNGRPGAALERELRRKRLAQAIWTITEELAATRIDYEYEFGAIEKWDEIQRGFADWARKNLAAFDGLESAAWEARNRGLPVADSDCLAPKIAGSTDLMLLLDSILSKNAAPRLGTGERHRLIAEVDHRITGEPLMTQRKVFDRIRKASVVNSGK